MNLRSSSELSRLLASCLSPRNPLKGPENLHILCLRTAAIYATTALYEFHDKQKSVANPDQISNWEDVFPLLDAHFLRSVFEIRFFEYLSICQFSVLFLVISTKNFSTMFFALSKLRAITIPTGKI